MLCNKPSQRLMAQKQQASLGLTRVWVGLSLAGGPLVRWAPVCTCRQLGAGWPPGPPPSALSSGPNSGRLGGIPESKGKWEAHAGTRHGITSTASTVQIPGLGASPHPVMGTTRSQSDDGCQVQMISSAPGTKGTNPTSKESSDLRHMQKITRELLELCLVRDELLLWN